jgi:hypothetical protein
MANKTKQIGKIFRKYGIENPASEYEWDSKVVAKEISALFKDTYESEFVEWLLMFCKQDIQDVTFVWVVEVETHVIEYMTTKEAYYFWTTNIKKLNQ